MIFKKLQIKNIRSYEDLEVSFPTGSVLLSGDIGSGKTSILLGLQFALFGLQPGQKGTSILRQGTDTAYARLVVEINGSEVVLERTIKKSKSGSITQDSNVLFINGVQEDVSTSEMKERVISLLNYPREFAKRSNLLYKFTVYTPQEEMKAIVQERPEVRLDTLRHIFGIDRYRRIKENTQIFLQKIKDAVRVKEVLVSELNLLKEKYAIEAEKKIQLARQRNNLQLEYDDLCEQRTMAQERVDALKRSLDEKLALDSDLSRVRVLLSGKRDLEARMKKEVLSMQKQTDEVIDFSADRLRSVCELLDKNALLLDEKSDRLVKVSSQISVLESKKDSQLSLKDKVTSLENCPTCFQVVGDEHKHKISKRTGFEIDDINRELEQKMHEYEQLKREVQRQKDLIKGYQSDKNVLQENKIKFEHQKSIQTKMKSEVFVLERTSQEIAELEEKVRSLEEKIASFSKSQDEFNAANLDLRRFVDESRSKELALASKRTEHEILLKQLDELSEEISAKEKIQDHLVMLRSLQDWLSEKFLPMITLTEKNVMMRLRNEFSAIFSEWFSMLVSDQLTVRLDEDFTPVVTNQDYEIDYEFLSGGERTAIALAYRLSLNQVLNSMLSQIKTKGIVILDEPTDGFSTEQIDKMRDIFEQLKADQLILVSHEQKIEGFVDHVIKVRKEGSSRVDV